MKSEAYYSFSTS